MTAHPRRLVTALAVFAALLVATFVVAGPTAAADPVRVMALGDSITGSPGCWRALLWQKLQQGGYTNVDMVGTLPAQGCAVPYDGDNEGHGGALATTVADQNQLVGWLASARPDVVLMHFGTNDVWSGRTTQQILAAFTTLVTQMRASNARIKVLVAQILPVAPPSCAECPQRTVALNAAIPAWAAGLSTSASPVTVVDQWTGWSPASDTGDGVHPNDTGIVKIADRWYPALKAALDGTAQPPVPPSPTPTPSPTTPRPTVTPTPTPTSGARSCTATYTLSSTWSGGFVASVRVTAGSAAITGWTVSFTLPNGQVTNVWNAQGSTSGSPTQLANVAWNGTLAAGQSTEAGFQGTGTGAASGVTCAAR